MIHWGHGQAFVDNPAWEVPSSQVLIHKGVDGERIVAKISKTGPDGRIEGCQGGLA